MQRELREQLEGMEPTASRTQVFRVMQKWQSVGKMPPPICQEVFVRLMDVLKTYAASKLKKDATEDTSSIFRSEAVTEKGLETLLHILKENDMACVVPMYWTLFQHLLNLMCLKKRQTTNEIRILTLQCVAALLRTVIPESKKLNEEALYQTDLNNCLAFAVYQCFAKIHEEHPRGEKEVAKGSFVVLRLLLDVFSVPALWLGVLPAAATELAALLSAIGKMVKNREAVLPSSRITEDAIRLFVRLLCFVLSDENVHHLVPPTMPSPTPLNQLQDMIGRVPKDGSHLQRNTLQSSEMEDVKKSPAIEGSWEWFQFSSKKVEKLIGQCLNPLVHHSHTNVRTALAEGAGQLIQKCKICLESCMQDLLRVLLTLSFDLFSKVSNSCQPAINHIKKQLSGAPEDCGWADGLLTAIGSLIQDQIIGLSDVIQSSETNTRTASRLLTAAIHVAGSNRFASWVLDDTLQLGCLYHAWISAFAFDTSAMDALYRSTDGIRGLKVSDRGPLFSTGIPKMPPALVFMTEHHTYAALSQFIRSASSAISLTRVPASGLQILMDRILDGLREACEQNASDCCLLNVTSHIYLLTEIIYGARNAEDGASSSHLEPFIWRMVQMVDTIDLQKSEADQSTTSHQTGSQMMFIRCLMEWIRVGGSLLNTHLLEPDCHIMNSWILLVLEGCADSSPFIQSSAKRTLLTLQQSLGFASASDLVLHFGDSIVQELCRRLHQLSSYPTAPALLTSLLRYVTGSSRKLLPLLAEPVSHVLRGLSIQGRSLAKQFTIPFLEALIEVAAITRDTAETIHSSLKNRQSIGSGSTFSDTVTSEILVQMKDLQSTSMLSNSAMHMTAPLFQDPRIQVCLMAFEVCTVGIKTLKCTTECCRLYEDRLMPAFPKTHPEVSMATVDIPQLSVVLSPLWKNLVVAMKRHPVAVIEGALRFFSDVAGTFDGRMLSRRFADEAWPLLKILLDQGQAEPPSVKRILPHKATFAIVQEADGDTGIALASRMRSQLAAFKCLERIGQDPIARSCLKTKFPEIVTLLFSFLSSENHSLEIQKKAFETLRAVSLVDADYVWAVFVDQSPEIPYRQDLWSFLESAEIAWHQRLRETVLRT